MIPIYVAVTAHGFGHATRTAAVMQALVRLNPEVLPIFVTPSPPWLLDKYMEGRYLHRPRRLDVGVIQKDGLQMDLEATLAELAAFQQGSAQLIEAEVAFIETNRVRLVFGDIPPIAAAIANKARLPCWMEGNFGWDFIYRPYGSEFKPYVQWIQDLYSRCDRLLKLPMHEPMAAFPHQELVGMTGGDPRFRAEEVREKLSLDPDRPLVLLTFGGFGILDFPYAAIEKFPDWLFLTFDAHAPELPNLRCLNGEIWRPVDVMLLCSQVVSKPGYGTLSEALRLGIPMNCITREGFAESPLLIEGLKRYGKHRIVPQEVFFEQPWTFLEDPFVDPTHPEELDTQGNQAIAQALNDYLTQ
ncbi:MAG: glycosyl transferase [Synechococcaceae cyanobacterium SM2_3_1]|nr:glycosyl transferase [Synechococcaceae cyanobacterium SM2_3_1]